MIGDVNIFLSPLDDERDEEEGTTPIEEGPSSASNGTGKQGELEIMIAEPTARRRGYASEALSLMMDYACDPANGLELEYKNLFARVRADNEGSIRLFERLGFRVVKEVAVFNEVEMRFVAGDSVKEKAHYSIANVPLV